MFFVRWRRGGLSPSGGLLDHPGVLETPRLYVPVPHHHVEQTVGRVPEEGAGPAPDFASDAEEQLPFRRSLKQPLRVALLHFIQISPMKIELRLHLQRMLELLLPAAELIAEVGASRRVIGIFVDR